MDDALIRCENGTLSIGEVTTEMGMHEPLYRRNSDRIFGKIKGTWSEEALLAEDDAYGILLRNFTEACAGKAELVAPGSEGRKSLLISNGAYLSSWQKRMIDLPEIGTPEERAFETAFEQILRVKQEGGTERT
jgi:hypothetical protein